MSPKRYKQFIDGCKNNSLSDIYQLMSFKIFKVDLGLIKYQTFTSG